MHNTIARTSTGETDAGIGIDSLYGADYIIYDACILSAYVKNKYSWKNSILEDASIYS